MTSTSIVAESAAKRTLLLRGGVRLTHAPTRQDAGFESAPFVVTEGKYAGYTVVVDEKDSLTRVWYEDRGPDVLRVHYRVFRIPSRPGFVLRHFDAATAEDRAEAEAMIPKLASAWEKWERAGKVYKRRHPTKGYYYWTLCAGSLVDDPLKQLELEMMIDLTSEVAS